MSSPITEEGTLKCDDGFELYTKTWKVTQATSCIDFKILTMYTDGRVSQGHSGVHPWL
jgi:hypothetical protein